MSNNGDIQSSVEEMKTLLNLQYESIDAFKDTARALLGSSSMAVAIMSTLQIFLDVPTTSTWSFVYQGGVVFTLLLYIALVTLCVRVLLPVDMSGPIKPNWDKIRDTIVGKEGRELEKQWLSNYLKAISKNEMPLSKTEKQVRWAAILLPVIIALMLLISLVPR